MVVRVGWVDQDLPGGEKGGAFGPGFGAPADEVGQVAFEGGSQFGLVPDAGEQAEVTEVDATVGVLHTQFGMLVEGESGEVDGAAGVVGGEVERIRDPESE